MTTFSIIIPAYNEEKAIASIIERCLEVRAHIIEETQINRVEIIVVNDGSTDRTGEIIKRYKKIKVISFEKNKGYGSALKEGIKQARGEIIGFLDADGTCDPMDFINICNTLEQKNADIVVGSRMNPLSDMPKIRKLGNKLWVWILSFISNKPLSDVASGMRVFRKSIINKLFPLPDGLHFTPAMSTKAILERDIKIVEIPISYNERLGKSKLNVIKDGIQFLKTIIEISLTYKPFKIFGIFGLILIFVALVYSVFPIFYYFQTKTVSEGMIYRFLAILVFIASGLNLIVLGIISSNVVNLIRGNDRDVGKLTTFINNIFTPKRMLWIGIFFILGGTILNYKTILQYLTTGHIYMHWSYIVVGGGLILIGFQLIFWGVMQKMLNILNEIKRYSISA